MMDLLLIAALVVWVVLLVGSFAAFLDMAMDDDPKAVLALALLVALVVAPVVVMTP